MFHREADPGSQCGGRVATRHARALFKVDYWCVYCGAKFNRPDSRARWKSRVATYVRNRAPEWAELWDLDYDPYGTIMASLFALAEALYARDDGPPEWWQYQPGAWDGDLESPDHELGRIYHKTGASSEAMEAWGETLRTAREVCASRSLDY